MSSQSPPAEFVSALMSFRTVKLDGSVTAQEVPAPSRIAPWTAAIEVAATDGLGKHQLGKATLVVMYDPEQEDLWDGPFRLVGQARMQIDAEQSIDPVLGEAIWHTLADSLDEAGAGYGRLVGTVTRELSETFGGLELQGSALNAELRCSWSPVSSDLGEHLLGWSEALRQNCGIESAAVTRFSSHFGERNG